jgi:hypothetical protein
MTKEEELNSHSNLEDNIYDTFYLFKKVSLVDKYNFYDYM